MFSVMSVCSHVTTVYNTWDRLPMVLTSRGHGNMYGCQAVGIQPTGMISYIKITFNENYTFQLFMKICFAVLKMM